MTTTNPYDRLRELHQRLELLAAEHKTLCGAPAPDRAAMSTTRWRIAEAGRHRMDLLNGTVFPLLAGSCSDRERQVVEAFRIETVAYQRHVSRYVARWSTVAILADWPAYQLQTRVFRSEVARRIAEERRVLMPLLARHLHASVTPAALQRGPADIRTSGADVSGGSSGGRLLDVAPSRRGNAISRSRPRPPGRDRCC